MKILYVILLSLISAILYRLGGSSKSDQDKEFPWIPRWFKAFPKPRDILSNILKLVCAFLMGATAPFWAYFLSFGLLWASLSTYWDELFGYDNHWFHGFMCGFSLLPIAIFTGDYIGFGVRCIVLALLMGIYSHYEGNATREELGRGFLLTIIELIKF